MKKMITICLSVTVFMMSTATVWAAHHNSGHNSGRAASKNVWHKACDNFDGHYSNQCSLYDHVWHDSTDHFEGHYAYDCTDYGHSYEHNNCHSAYHQYRAE